MHCPRRCTTRCSSGSADIVTLCRSPGLSLSLSLSVMYIIYMRAWTSICAFIGALRAPTCICVPIAESESSFRFRDVTVAIGRDRVSTIRDDAAVSESIERAVMSRANNTVEIANKKKKREFTPYLSSNVLSKFVQPAYCFAKRFSKLFNLTLSLILDERQRPARAKNREIASVKAHRVRTA